MVAVPEVAWLSESVTMSGVPVSEVAVPEVPVPAAPVAAASASACSDVETAAGFGQKLRRLTPRREPKQGDSQFLL